MDAALSVVNAWKDLIVGVFKQYPLAAAIITLLAVGAWVYLEKKVRPGQAPTNTLLVLLGWSIAVPLFGGVLWLFGELWALIKAVAPPVASAVSSLFSIYSRHPFLVLSLVGIAIVAYYAWKRWRPNILPSPLLRFLSLAVAVTVVAHVLGPIADYVVPAMSPTTNAPQAPASASATAQPSTAPNQNIKPTSSPAKPASGAP